MRRVALLGAFAVTFALSGAASASTAAADVPSFRSGEYQVTTTIAGSEALSKKVCLNDYGDWFASLRKEFKKQGCDLDPDVHVGAEYRYRAVCDNGLSGTLAVTKLSDSIFTSVAEIELPIAGLTQTISTHDRATRIGDCPSE